LRGPLSNWICGFSAYLGICSSVKTELLGLLHGLKMAWMKGVPRLLVHMDSEVVVNIIKATAYKGQPHYFLIRECQKLIRNTNWKIRLAHCYREANRVADLLANIGVDQASTFVLFDLPPYSVRSLLVDDSHSVAWPCLLRN